MEFKRLKRIKTNQVITFLKGLLSLVVIITPCWYFGYNGKITEMSISIIAGAIAATFLNLDRVNRVKGAGFEAEMYKAVEDVYATIDTLKDISNPLVYSTFSILNGESYFGGVETETKYELSQKLDDIIAFLDINDEEIKQVKSTFNKTLVQEFFGNFIGTLKNHGLTSELLKMHNFPTKEELEPIFQMYKSTFDEISLDSKQRFERYLEMRKKLLNLK